MPAQIRLRTILKAGGKPHTCDAILNELTAHKIKYASDETKADRVAAHTFQPDDACESKALLRKGSTTRNRVLHAGLLA
jgi:hypothetical protein